jgi:adenosylcobinamide-phosphate synthase
MVLGVLADAVVADPRRGHPVALFGRAASALEQALWRDSRAAGVVFAAACTAPVLVVGVLADRCARNRRVCHALLVATATWISVGGTSLHRAGLVVARALEDGDLDAARAGLRHLCARDVTGLDETAVARATVESVAENTSDAVVAPLVWGALGGVPGLLTYRAVNTLDAMVGYRDNRFRRFGWAAARLDDIANLVPARLSGLLAVLLAGAVGGSPAHALRIMRRDGHAHPSPNAGHPEAAFAGALGVRLGGCNRYRGHAEIRPSIGDGADPGPATIAAAVRLSTAVGLAAAILVSGLSAAAGRRR